MLTNKEIITAALPNMGVTFALLLIITLLQLNIHQAAGLIILYTVLTGEYAVYKEKLTRRQASINLFSILALLFIIVLVNEYTGLNPILTFLIIGLIISGYILFVRRKELLAAMRYIEKKHFGETAEERKERLKQ